jgi:hypothetical protein
MRKKEIKTKMKNKEEKVIKQIKKGICGIDMISIEVRRSLGEVGIV